MTGLDELRSTLRAEADGLTDTGLAARTDAVHGRVRIARRRRRAGVAVAAALLVGGTALTTQVLDRDGGRIEPAEEILGQKVPTDIRIDGVLYHLTDVERLTPGRKTQLIGDIGDDPQQTYSTLIVDGLSGGDVTLQVDDATVARLWSDGAASPVDSYRGATVSASGPDDARIALATYTPTDDVGPGVSAGGVTFREQVGTRELVNAAFSRPDGAPTASVTAPGTLSTAWIAMSCQADASEKDLYVKVVGSAGQQTGGTCDQSGDALPSASAGFTAPDGETNQVTYRVVLSRGEDGPAITDPGVATVGIAVYRSLESKVSIPGPDADSIVTYGSRVWKVERTVSGPDAFDGVTIATPPGPDGDRLLMLAGGPMDDASDSITNLTWDDAGQRSAGATTNGGGMAPAGVILSGQPITVRLDAINGGESNATIVIYKPIRSRIE